MTSAPPALVDGERLPYTAPGRQVVLLRYTSGRGWEIADVPRKEDGTAYELIPEREGFRLERTIVGQLAPSGEAWLFVAESSGAIHEPPPPGEQGRQQAALFHRLPGQPFRRDAVASETLREAGLTGGGGQHIRLHQNPGGNLTGTFFTRSRTFGLLDNGVWSIAQVPNSGGTVTVADLAPDGPESGWAFLWTPDLRLARFRSGMWTFPTTGLPAFDEPGRQFVTADLYPDRDAIWLGARDAAGQIVARYDRAAERITRSWCARENEPGCELPLDSQHPAGLPRAVFHTSDGEVALASEDGFVQTYEDGDWTRRAAPGYGVAKPVFTAPDEGWLPAPFTAGHWTSRPQRSQLTAWPQPNRAPLTGVAIPPGSHAGRGEAGPLAVGLRGTALHFDPAAGWQVDSVPSRARLLNLFGVAYRGANDAVAVGSFGAILRWNGSKWSEDPQSFDLTSAQLNAVAAGRSGDAWAVGTFGTILHLDATSGRWSLEEPPASESGANITSVAVAGDDVFAVAGGNLITRRLDGSWRLVVAELPSSVPRDRLNVVSGLPDGGIVAAGDALGLVRHQAGQAWEYWAQPLEGEVVAAAAYRSGGRVKALISTGLPRQRGSRRQIPPGDAELLSESNGGWIDVQRAQYPGAPVPGDGVVKGDPALAIAVSPDGRQGWVGGGYAGSAAAGGLGTTEPLPTRPIGWFTSSIWRFEEDGPPSPPALGDAAPEAPALPGRLSFAFFSGPMCRVQCTAVVDAQPDVNLTGAARQVAAFARQPGGPAFAVLGGNARGPSTDAAFDAGLGRFEFPVLPSLLAPLGAVPIKGVFGPRDAVPGLAEPDAPWKRVFGPARHYAFRADHNGTAIQVIVLDNSAGTLEGSDPGQTQWLLARLAEARAAGLPIIAFAALPLRAGGAQDGSEVARLLAEGGASAVFTSSVSDLNERHAVPVGADPAAQIPAFEGASLGYQRTQNNGVAWYFVTVDARPESRTPQGRAPVGVAAIPVLASLAIKPIDGLSVGRSSTLRFEGIARRPPGTLATTIDNPTAPGFDNYVAIPSPSCGARPCIQPSYSFKSSDPTIGDFVVASGPGSPYPRLDSTGKPSPSRTSGLFCAYNSGETTVSITTGLLTYSVPVSVRAGGFGPPCGTVERAGVRPRVVVRQPPPPGSGGVAPPGGPSVQPIIPDLAVPVPAPPVPTLTPLSAPVAPLPQPPNPSRPVMFVPEPGAAIFTTAVLLPPIVPPQVPVPPPSGGIAQSPAAARRKQEVQKLVEQSAFALRTGGSSLPMWYLAAVGGAGIAAALLAASAVGRRRVSRRRVPAPVVVRHG